MRCWLSRCTELASARLVASSRSVRLVAHHSDRTPSPTRSHHCRMASGSSLIAATELRLPPALTTARWRRAAANTGVAPHRRRPSRGVTVRRAAELPRGRVVACVALLRLQSPCAGPRRSVVRQTTSTVAQLLCRGARSEALSSSLIVVVGRRRGAVALLRRRVRTLALLCATRGRAHAPRNLIRPTTDHFKNQTLRYNQSSTAVLPRNRARASRAGS